VFSAVMEKLVQSTKVATAKKQSAIVTSLGGQPTIPVTQEDIDRLGKTTSSISK